jgi:queuosine precursor transporter
MINELLFILVILVSFVMTLLAVKLGKEWLIVIPPVFIIIANTFAPQLINVFGLVTSLAVPIYASIFLATDIIAEHWGKKEARKVVWIAFLAQIFALIFSQIIIQVQVLEISQAVHESLSLVFGFTPRIVLGSLVAYVISQNWDVWVFHSLKEKTKGKHLWLRNNASTMGSQLIDSFIFIFIAFYGVLPGIVPLALSLWILKIGIALVDTPIVYLSYSLLGKRRTKDQTLNQRP